MIGSVQRRIVFMSSNGVLALTEVVSAVMAADDRWRAPIRADMRTSAKILRRTRSPGKGGCAGREGSACSPRGFSRRIASHAGRSASRGGPGAVCVGAGSEGSRGPFLAERRVRGRCARISCIGVVDRGHAARGLRGRICLPCWRAAVKLSCRNFGRGDQARPGRRWSRPFRGAGPGVHGGTDETWPGAGCSGRRGRGVGCGCAGGSGRGQRRGCARCPGGSLRRRLVRRGQLGVVRLAGQLRGWG